MSRINLVIDQKYVWVGYSKVIFKSFDKTDQLGDQKVIAGEVFYVDSIDEQYVMTFFSGIKKVKHACNWTFLGVEKQTHEYRQLFWSKLYNESVG